MKAIRSGVMASNSTFSKGTDNMNQNGLDSNKVSFYFCKKMGQIILLTSQ